MTKYNEKLAEKICELIATSSMGLREICKTNDFPDHATIRRWIKSNRKLNNEDDKEVGFCDLYARAKLEQADLLVEEMFDIADDGTNDWEKRHHPDGSEYYALNAEHVQRSRLRVDTRKWAASKLHPNKYGDKQQIDHTNKGAAFKSGPESYTKEELIALIGKKPTK